MWQGPTQPPIELLVSTAPFQAWDEAIKQASRSPMIKFRCGAAIWNNARSELIGRGTSHPDIIYSKVLASIHAEQHALNACNHLDLEGCWCLLYTLNGRGGHAWTSRPCYSCARSLYRKNVERVIYAERLESGRFIVKSEHPEELLSRVGVQPVGRFARNQRIP